MSGIVIAFLFDKLHACAGKGKGKEKKRAREVLEGEDGAEVDMDKDFTYSWKTRIANNSDDAFFKDDENKARVYNKYAQMCVLTEMPDFQREYKKQLNGRKIAKETLFSAAVDHQVAENKGGMIPVLATCLACVFCF